MKKDICTKLRKKAEGETVGMPSSKTRQLYRKYKREWKRFITKTIEHNFNISKRQQRIYEKGIIN